MTKMHELAQLGQAIWYDYIRRAFIASGDLQALIDQGLRGVTSNPTIFEKAIVGSADYDEDLRWLVEAGTSVDEIYEALAVDDVGRAADLFRPVYQQTNGLDGYVSLEVSPQLSHDTADTVAEARRLFAVLGRPNVMIKVPATPEGIPAVETLIGEGINVNVTLIFALARYQEVAEAYLAGLEKLAAKGGDLTRVASVASFFVSRVDTAVDRVLEKMGNTELQGKAAIANAKNAYAHFRGIFSGARWERLARQGARVQRPLWASSGTKNPHYPDTLYVDSLIGPDTVNTVPPATLQAYLDHGAVASTLGVGLEEARAHLAHLAELGVDLDAITKQLEDEGVAAFAKSFETLLASIATKQDRLQASHKDYHASLGDHQAAVDAALADLKANNVMNRIWAHDYTVWKPQPIEITNRLGWLHSPDIMPEHVLAITDVVEAVRADGYTHALLLGMGGSSLAPEVFRHTFGVKEGYLDLAVLDSTDPRAVLAHAERLDMTRTLFIVSTKSGSTTETISFFKFFYNRVADTVGARQAGRHFIAITDPGSPLVATAKKYDFRATFLNDPNIGGRYSALSYFGLVPAALLGVDVPRLLDRAYTMACNSEGCNSPVGGNNTSAWLGAVMGELAAAGRDKVTLVASPPIAAFGAWVEQLIAESTGKEGKGILPVTDEPLGPPTLYGNDRLFVYLRLQGEETHDDAVHALINAGQPVVYLHLLDRYDLGGEFFRWEMATALAGRRIGINPFDQPNVEAAKVLARQMVAAYQKDGSPPRLAPTLEAEGIAVYADGAAKSLAEALHGFLAQARPGDYVALQAYVQPAEQASVTLQQLRTRLRDRLRLATTVGYGPRFLHSTGQLHKGDAGNGLFLQFTDNTPQDAPIPDEPGSPTSSITFGVLKMAQALGDRQALLDARPRRRIIAFHLDKDVAGGLEKLMEVLA
jgi:transaldolase/glucose-6-phosphate isomerase